ncbi:GerAB/ArcD/ProY family transporter [Bacillus sp. ISL-75]|uniref:GerAB/ArcD/ProY family transporter n=1 Tax=Bacillus sp. ISL-75 TaxID=2819137 RepID=UPI001BE5B5E5|nr:GerAB/ArcD/ProY family transporter [Bacillus sp. ISL-75]MBT2729697.1 GerAB/ArcD/ProY family transporter [Bacillus sp. ISL-75]
MKTNKITPNQITLFLILYFFSTFVGFFSVQLIEKAQYDSVLVICISGFVGCIYAYLTVKLANRRPKEFIVHYGKEIFPYWIHFFLMGFIFLFCLHGCSILLREYDDFLILVYLPGTPGWAVGTLFGIVIAITARLGVVAIFRAAQGLFFIILFSLLFNNIFIGKELKFDRWMAFVTNHTFPGILKGSYFTSPFLAELVLFVFIFPFFTEKNKTLKSMVWGIIFACILITTQMVSMLLLFGPSLISHLSFPMLEMVRFIHIGELIENLDPLLIAVWSTTVYLKISFFLYLSSFILAQLFSLKDHRPFTFSLAAIMVAMSIRIAKNAADLSFFFETTWATYAYFIESIPILYLLMDTVRQFWKKRASKKAEN